MPKLLFILLLFPSLVYSQTPSSIQDKTKNLKPYPGFLKFYWDENNGKIFLEINKLDSEFLYQISLPAGLGSNDLGLDRGKLGNTSIIKFKRVANKVLMVEPNYGFRGLTKDMAEKRAVEESFAESILWGFQVEAETNGTLLVDATSFLMRDAFQVTNRLSTSRQGSYSVDVSRSAIHLPQSRNFPLNTELETIITFTTKDATQGNFVSSVTPSPEAISLRVHHTFAELPDNKYKPRKFDPRSGYIPVSFFDYSSPVSEPIEKFYIMRHRLEKKDPSASMSEPLKPIIYYLDNGTPEPIRSALLEGASWWNKAFEAAGFINAFQVKKLPEGADPMDIRYNIINWVHRSTRGWSYGAAVTDPRTGEIIKGNVTLGSLRVRQDYLIAQGLLAPYENGIPADDKMLKMALQRLKQLSAHEIGHTLGLMHNYISSTQGNASVMDYPAPMVSLNTNGDLDLGNAYSNEIGEWDKVSINYGYREFAPGSDEQGELKKIISNASKNMLTFISDRDARSIDGLHPTAHLWDVGKDPVASLKDALKIREHAMVKFGLNNIPENTSLSMLEDVFVPVYLFHRYQVEAVAKQVGGMNYTYAVKGDGQSVTRPTSKAEQVQSLNALLDCIAPQTLLIPDRIVKMIPPRPAGYNYTKELFKRKTGLAFDQLSAAESAADFPLSFLFNPARLNRMIEYEAANNGLGVNEMLDIIMSATWKAPKQPGVKGLILKQNQQLVLGYLLSSYMSTESSFAVKAALIKTIDEIKTMLSEKLNLAGPDKGYYLLTLERIEKRYEAAPYITAPMPPGAPIGCDMD